MNRIRLTRAAHDIKAAPVVIDSAFTAVTYIGARASYTDGTYGTRISWDKGDTRMVPAAAARLMLTHKDVYEPGTPVAELPVLPVKATEEDKVQDMRDALAIMDKESLTAYAQTHFSVKLDKRKDVGLLRTQVTGLVDQYGVA